MFGGWDSSRYLNLLVFLKMYIIFISYTRDDHVVMFGGWDSSRYLNLLVFFKCKSYSSRTPEMTLLSCLGDGILLVT